MVSMGEWSQAAPVVAVWWCVCVYIYIDQVYLNSGIDKTQDIFDHKLQDMVQKKVICQNGSVDQCRKADGVQ